MNEEKDVEEVNKQDDMQLILALWIDISSQGEPVQNVLRIRSSVSNLESAAMLNNQPTWWRKYQKPKWFLDQQTWQIDGKGKFGGSWTARSSCLGPESLISFTHLIQNYTYIQSFIPIYISTFIIIHLFIHTFNHSFLHSFEREKERKRERDKERKRERERNPVICLGCSMFK